ncbi:hypothetical protein MLD38_015172 [Melastoma candidum]|uniref:Uncharacterized protein n=1 Tax=Melastoma candidum TaxID=119954 RepID=A0ACB9RJF3_9MYRT|nr:hypothetical protein MLD38_015172 [Melastoma candidum]
MRFDVSVSLQLIRFVRFDVFAGLTCSNLSCPITRARLRSRVQGFLAHCSNLGHSVSDPEEIRREIRSVNCRNAIGFARGLPASLFFYSIGANSVGSPPEEKPKLCDTACGKELEMSGVNGNYRLGSAIQGYCRR